MHRRKRWGGRLPRKSNRGGRPQEGVVTKKEKMAELIHLKDYRKSKTSRQDVEVYLQYLRLLHLSELLHEAKRLIKKIQRGKISQSTGTKGNAVTAELLGRIKKREALACKSLDHLPN